MNNIWQLDNMEDYVKCVCCGAVMKKEIHFCTSCGKQMIQTVVPNLASEVPSLQKEIQEKICPNCGVHLAEDSVFCIECGTKQ